MRIATSEQLASTGVIAVLRADHASAYQPVIAALVQGGVSCIELTLTTPGTLEALADLIARNPEAEIGVGTVLGAADALRAVDDGARFLVTPNSNPEVIGVAASSGIASFSGAMSPTEVASSWSAGASAVKIFPASLVGPDYLKYLAGPFPDVQAVPSGGVGLDDIRAWIEAGAIAVSLGGPLIGDALRGGDLAALTERSRRARGAVSEARRKA